MTSRGAVAALFIAFTITGCTRNDPQEVKKQAADATAQIKKGSEVAAQDLKQGAKALQEDTQAAAQGVKEGWNGQTKDSPQSPRRKHGKRTTGSQTNVVGGDSGQ